MATQKIKIPASIEEAQGRLNGLERLLTATEWEKAAIVAAFVSVSTHGGNRSVKITSDLAPKEFAALGITGLKSEVTVRRYVAAWEKSGKPKPRPGVQVTLPTVNFTEIAGTVQTTQQKLSNSPGGIAGVLADGKVRQKVIDNLDPETRKQIAAEIISESTSEEIEEISGKSDAIIVKPLKSKTGARSKQEKDDKRKDTAKQFGLLAGKAEGRIRAARQALVEFIEIVGGAEFNDEERDLIATSWARLEAALPLARAAATGQSGADWDEALASLVKE